MSRELPPIIKQVGFDFNWDERKVWAIDAPTETIATEELAWHLDIPFLWTKPDGFYDLTPRSVLGHPDQYPEEYARMLNANLRYPIDIMQKGEQWVILDGLHRLMKAVLQERDTVTVRKIPTAVIPLIRKDT
jgi:hypothetical protein